DSSRALTQQPLGSIQERLHLVYCRAHFFRTAKKGGDFRHCATFRDGWYFENFWDLELCRAEFNVLVQHLRQYSAGFGCVLIEKVSLFFTQVLCPFTTRSQWCVECYVAEQIKWIGIGLIGRFGQFVERDA